MNAFYYVIIYCKNYIKAKSQVVLIFEFGTYIYSFVKET